MSIEQTYHLVSSVFAATLGFLAGFTLRTPSYASKPSVQPPAKPPMSKPPTPDNAANLVLLAHAAYDLGRHDHATGRPPRSRADVMVAARLETLRPDRNDDGKGCAGKVLVGRVGGGSGVGAVADAGTGTGTGDPHAAPVAPIYPLPLLGGPSAPASRAVPQSTLNKAVAFVASMPAVPATPASEPLHSTLYLIARGLVYGYALPISEAWPILRAYGRRCDPPWSDEQLWRQIEEASSAPHSREFPVGYMVRGDIPVSVVK